MKKKVSNLIAEFLENERIVHAFGIIGAGCAHTFDSIGRHGYTEIVCVHHEQAAVMATQTYYRTCGKVAAVLLTTGGGSSNAITGVVSAWMDSIPSLIISGNENSCHTSSDNPLRIWGVQGYDSVRMVAGITKYAVRVTDPHAILRELDKALRIATTGRLGPVWIDVPMDIQASMVDEDDLLPLESVAPSLSAPSNDDLNTVWEALKQAKRPLIWLGHGIRLAGADALCAPLLETLSIPAIVSWAGIDMIDSDHPLVYGRAGVYGQRAANFVLQNCDFLLAIGTRMAIPQIGYDLSELARSAQIAVVDIDPTELEKLKERVAFPICADAKLFIDALNTAAARAPLPSYADWIKICDDWRRRYPWVDSERDHPDVDGFINSYPFMERLQPFLKNDQIVVTDMGTALLSGHQVLKCRPGQRLMTSTGLGEMGYGLPAAVGSSFARNRGEVMCLNCDGGMMMNLQELQTIVHHHLPIKIFVFNNDGYLMIKHTQKALFKGKYIASNAQSGVTCPDFAEIAKAFGLPSFQIRTWKDFDEVIPEVQAYDGPLICEVFTHPEQLFVPKLSTIHLPDGKLVSPPLEDLSPLLPRQVLRKEMLVGLHPKSESMN